MTRRGIRQGSLFVDSDWITKPVYHIDDDQMLICPEHGEFCPAAYYDDFEIGDMMVTEGRISCPYCLDEITGGM